MDLRRKTLNLGLIAMFAAIASQPACISGASDVSSITLVPTPRAMRQDNNGVPIAMIGVTPRIYTSAKPLFANLLLGLHASPTHIAHLGDSTSTDVVGAGGLNLSWRRWLWHQHFGHTPATQLAPATTFAGVPPGQFLLAQTIVGVDPSIVPDTFLAPGFFEGQFTAYTAQLGSGPDEHGFFVHLNHNNDNNVTLQTGRNPLFFTQVAPAVNAGVAAYATGTMFGGASLIDARGGLRLEVIAASHPTSVPDVAWRFRPIQSLAMPNIDAPIIQSGMLFGGDKSLQREIGHFFKDITPPLGQLSGNQGSYQIQVAGNTTSGNPEQSAQIIGTRYLSQNPAGLVIDSLSQGGYTSASFIANFPNCGALLRTIDYDLAWICYGANDSFVPYSKAQYEANIRSLIAFLRTQTGKPTLPIVLEASHLVAGEGDDARFYPDALYQIASDTPNILFINSRRLALERFGWGSGSEYSYLVDGIHFTNLGAEIVARCSIETIISLLSSSSWPATFIRQPNHWYAKDTQLSKSAPTQNYGDNPELIVGADATGSDVHRILIDFQGLASLSFDAQIQSAFLTLTVKQAAASREAIEIARCTHTEWIEGEGNPYGTSWTYIVSVQQWPWTTPGGDYSEQEIVTGFLPVASTSPPESTVSYDITPLVLDAIAHRNGYLSLLIKRSNENARGIGIASTAIFHSSDLQVSSKSPMLTVNYIAPPVVQLSPCAADTIPQPNGNGVVNVDDLLAIIGAWGPVAIGSPFDIAPTFGAVDVDDLLTLISSWGPCP